MMTLAFLSYLTDLKGITKPFTPFKAMGMNALMAFVCSGLIAKTLRLAGFSASEHFGANEFTSLAYALLFTLVIFCIQWILYKKKVIIKL
jgi:predicted acyltransferase